jgi:hypothetical protein
MAPLKIVEVLLSYLLWKLNREPTRIFSFVLVPILYVDNSLYGNLKP